MNCKKCGKEMKKYGPYAKRKVESGAVPKGPDAVHYECMNTECAEFHKSISVLE